MPFPLDAIIINDELQRRPSRPPDFEAESKALVRLARSMAETPQHVLRALAEAALGLCGAGSAGISLAETENGNDIFRWQATAGAFAPLIGSTMPRDFSPCGTVVDRNASQLMANPARYYDYIATMSLPVLELLLIPFYRDGVAIGTIWAVSHTCEPHQHSPRRQFGDWCRDRGGSKPRCRVDTARGMARLLKLVGHEVKTAHSGPESIEVAKEYQPEFVLLDIGLPGMSGYEVASKLRQEECCKDAVIVAVSGYGQDEDRHRSKDAGFDHHLTKPLDYDALIALLSVGSSGRP